MESLSPISCIAEALDASHAPLSRTGLRDSVTARIDTNDIDISVNSILAPGSSSHVAIRVRRSRTILAGHLEHLYRALRGISPLDGPALRLQIGISCLLRGHAPSLSLAINDLEIQKPSPEDPKTVRDRFLRVLATLDALDLEPPAHLFWIEDCEIPAADAASAMAIFACLGSSGRASILKQGPAPAIHEILPEDAIVEEVCSRWPHLLDEPG